MILVGPSSYYEHNAHLFCDKPESLDELHEFAQSIGLKRERFQDHDMMPHYDLTRRKRADACRAGATAVTMKGEAKWIRKWRNIEKTQ